MWILSFIFTIIDKVNFQTSRCEYYLVLLSHAHDIKTRISTIQIHKLGETWLQVWIRSVKLSSSSIIWRSKNYMWKKNYNSLKKHAHGSHSLKWNNPVFCFAVIFLIHFCADLCLCQHDVCRTMDKISFECLIFFCQMTIVKEITKAKNRHISERHKAIRRFNEILSIVLIFLGST